MHERSVKVASVVGTRPNFAKVAPVVRQIQRRGNFSHMLIHTGQHYDEMMSRVFFEELGLPTPDVYLGVGSGSHTGQTARILEGLEPVLRGWEPDIVLVPGDVNSTLAAALAAKQLEMRVGHIEAGLRSFDRTMPEELNRVLTDQISDLLFIHSPEARGHLLNEGRPANAIFAVGNTMIDTLVQLRQAIESRNAPQLFDLEPGRYVLVTLHRPALVDGPMLADAVGALCGLAEEFTVVFPVHPRTRVRLAHLEPRRPVSPRLRLMDALGYLDFLGLAADAAAVLTDSGGVQEETTFLGVPCFTLRDNTERPVTVDLGTNTLLGMNPQRILEIPQLLASRKTDYQIPQGWDGHAAERIVSVLEEQADR